jgi:hypothetical protein
MANPEHLAILKLGVEAWNAWRQESDETPDLSETDLSKMYLDRADLVEADLSRTNLSWAHLTYAILFRTNLAGANLVGARLAGAHLARANLVGANLSGANLFKADLSEVDLTNGNLSGAILEQATLVGTILQRAELRNCRIFGLSVWGVDLKEAIQKDLVITAGGEPAITVDNLEVAQFIYLLLHNPKIRQVIDTITSKVVLILGRFTPERKAVLDRLRDELRERNFLPVLFDFEGPESRDVTETVSTLAHMARFVVADLTDPRSIPQELQKIVPQLPSLPVQPIILEGQEPWGMFPHFERYPWVLPPYRYASLEQLAEALSEHVVGPAVRKAEELRAVPPAGR